MLNKLVSVVICFPTESADIVYIDPMHPGTHPIINQSNKQTNKKTKKTPTQTKKQSINQSINQSISFNDFLQAIYKAQDNLLHQRRDLDLIYHKGTPDILPDRQSKLLTVKLYF